MMNRGRTALRMLAEPAVDALLLRGNIGRSGRHPQLLVLLSYLYCNFAGPDGMFATSLGSRPSGAHPTFQHGDIHMKHGKTRLFALAAAHGASLLAVPPVLQAAETGQLEEIVVTARQREERIEDVPVSITAFTASEIRSAGIQRPQDFVALTTGVSAVQTAEAGDMQLNIRGINTGRDSETNFALVIDGVLQTNPQALNQELSGVTQIEVLKGPQGALYGRNALAGALILTTRKPGEEFEADLKAGYGSDNSYNGSIYLGGAAHGRREGLHCGVHAQDRRPVEEPEEQLRRLRRPLRGNRRVRPPAVRSLWRRHRRQGQVLPARLRRHQLQRVDRARRRGAVRRPGVLRGCEQAQLPLHQQRRSRRTSRRTSTSRSRATGTSASAR